MALFPPSRPLAAASQQNTTFVSSSEAAFGRIVSLPETLYSVCEKSATLWPKDTFSSLKLNERLCYSGAVRSLESDSPPCACSPLLARDIYRSRHNLIQAKELFVRCVSICIANKGLCKDDCTLLDWQHSPSLSITVLCHEVVIPSVGLRLVLIFFFFFEKVWFMIK